MTAAQNGNGAGRKFDPILVEVMKHELAAMSEEMAIAISRTGRSSQVRVGDFAVAMCDEDGQFFDSGYTFPLQLVGFDGIMRNILRQWKGKLNPGDILLFNDPFVGMGHMPDTAVCAPIFWRDKLVAYTLSYSHHTDVGGRFPGSFSSQPTSSFEEGIRIPPMKFYAGGKRNEELLEMILANVRTPDDWIGDIEAKIAGTWRGARELNTLLDKHGYEALRASCDYIMDATEAATRAAISQIADGTYEAEGSMDDDGGGKPADLRFRMKMIVKGDRLTIDLSDVPDQVPNAINCPYDHAKGVALGTLKTLIAPDAVMNSGFTRPIDFIVPEGKIFHPRYPAAVGGRAPVTQVITVMTMTCLSQAMPGQAPVMGEPGDLMHLTGHDSQGRTFAMMDTFFGGWGGRPTKDGIDGVAMMQLGSTGLVPAEMVEREYPLVVEGFGYVADTAGPGKNRGSVAIYRRWRYLEDGHVMIRTTRPGLSPIGIQGGQPGSRSTSVLTSGGETKTLPAMTHYHLSVKKGDIIHHEIGGTAGYGDPMDRDPAQVEHDVREGKLSVETARKQYGVVIDPANLTANEKETAALRSRSARA